MSYSAERHSVIRVRAAYRDSRHEAGLSHPVENPAPPPRRPSTPKLASGLRGGRRRPRPGRQRPEGLWMWGNCAPALCPRPAPCSDAHGVDL